MNRPLHEKSSTEQIRARFDADVERFSKIETGQQAAMDAVLILETVARIAATRLKPASRLLDLGCGAGNFSLRVLRHVTPLNCTLVDLSRPMLDRAEHRIRAVNTGHIESIQADMRTLDFAVDRFDVIVAGQTLHHLRAEDQWKTMFTNVHRWLRPGGLLLVADLVAYDDPAIQKLMLERYGEHLEQIGGVTYRDKVFAYCDEEDSPRSTRFQLDLLAKSGFSDFDILHKNALFAAYYGRK